MESVDEKLSRLLADTSRTFALTIPYLPEPTRRAVMVAYLVLRIADSLEDGHWPPERKAHELSALASALRGSEPAALLAFAARLQEGLPIEQDACLRLMAEAESVFAALLSFPPGTRGIVARHTAITSAGMAKSVLRQEGAALRLRSLPELREYCYFVAGAVGEMLSELFLADWPLLAPVASALRRDSRAFGEGLQLTNILKDADEDAGEGRHFLPESVPRAELFALARQDLDAARRYVGTLREAGAPPGLLAFTALPVRLAAQTLREVERRGAGAKVARSEVAQAVAELNDALDRGELSALLQRGWMVGDLAHPC